ncbi:hypothetical protein Y032_0041g387 [Ancylostoma ceylanicum]|uniref:C-type lectin domain-containing protein n=1 Tax=Ancylostoma ceylanicum TaxID=53326 RepID=A0A016UH85_9BILA|nr:hypothetical protein Y032_0041g387 [Ancylostoma ceylanicum]
MDTPLAPPVVQNRRGKKHKIDYSPPAPDADFDRAVDLVLNDATLPALLRTVMSHLLEIKGEFLVHKEKKMTRFWLVSICILCLSLVPSTEPDPVIAQDTFSQFCKHPGQFGQGEMQGTTKCIVKFPKGTKTAKEAAEFCRKLSPYTTTSSKEGKPTVCTYEKEYVCEEHEENLFDYCFVVKKPTGEPFSRDACPEGYTLHVLHSKEEFQWIAVVYEKYSKLWVGNAGSSADFLKPTERPKIKKRDYMMLGNAGRGDWFAGLNSLNYAFVNPSSG